MKRHKTCSFGQSFDFKKAIFCLITVGICSNATIHIPVSIQVIEAQHHASERDQKRSPEYCSFDVT